MTEAAKKTLAMGSLALWIIIWGGAGLNGWRAQTQVQTQRNPLADWRPTDDAPGIRYVGARACAQCRKHEASTQLASPMAHALESTSECLVLNEHTRMT